MTKLTAQQTERIEYEIEFVQKNFSEAQEAFKKAFETNPVYALEWKAPRVASTQGAYETIFPLIGATSSDNVEVETLTGWIERTIEQLEDRMMETSGDMYAPNSSSAIANYLKVETTRGKMEGRLVLKRILKVLEQA